ncbi:MAG TPA: GGDEF domain-containing protein, partial [Bradyrhizobium sp.]|nr:GGDEF domain-containing protein [Bradyrhizobium sp.]
MSLDTSTLYVLATMIAAMLGAMLLFFGRQENIAALKWWGAAYLLGAASIALWTLASDILGETFSLALNAVGFLACGMVWNASRVFHGRKPNVPGLLLGAIGWIAAVMTLAPEASAMRTTVGAGIVALYAALTANELWRERRRALQRRWPTIVVPV